EDLKLIDYRISSVGQGKDALAEATVQLLVNNKQMTGRATSHDVIKAFANALLNAVNRYVIEKQVQQVETNVQLVYRLQGGKIVSKNIILLPCDGIGQEVINSAQKVLEKISEIYGSQFNFEQFEIGGTSYDLTGSPLTDGTIAACKSADAILLGAVGGPKW